MTDPVKIVECPRDAWQGLPAHIPAESKAAYLRRLVAAGFKHIDAVSFVSPRAVPQMSDSEQVLALFDPPSDTEIIGIVVNEKGAARAIRTGRVHTLGFPYSISPEFLHRNQNQTQEDSLRILGSVAEPAIDAGMNVVAYLSMAFGNPYGDAWSVQAAVDACGSLVDAGIRHISLADTVGTATIDQITAVVGAVMCAHKDVEVGVHLHARRDQAAMHIRAAYHAGCRRFDSAIGGHGGCPFAQDDLVGNIPTEILLEELSRCGAELPSIALRDDLIQLSAKFAHYPEAGTR